MYRLGLTTQWVSVIRIFRTYWRAYGGTSAFFTSPYVHVSLIITVLCSGYWKSNPWYDTALSLVPGLLGFTLAAYTIILTIGNDQFREVLASILFPAGTGDKKTDNLSKHTAKAAEPQPHSLLMVNSTIFLHVLIAQILAVFSSVFAKQYHLVAQTDKAEGALKNSWWAIAFHGIGYYYFVYSVLLILAACIAVFRLSQQIDKFLRDSPRRTEN